MENETNKPNLEVVESKKISAEEIRIAAEKEKQERSDMCSAEINEVLKKHNCNLAISGFVITAN